MKIQFLGSFTNCKKTGEIVDFSIRNIEIIGNDIYFFGLLWSPLIKANFSYVQKRNLNNDFTPIRKDLELTTISATREITSNNAYFILLIIRLKI